MKIRLQTLLALGVGGIGLLAAFVAGMWIYVSATATPLHPDLQGVPSEARSAPPARWAKAAEQARQLARGAVVEQNLPGLSVAVGAGGEIVWAEGLGWSDLEEQVRVTPDTRFRIGSASTLLTSAAVGLLLEKNRLALDTEIQTYVPAFPKKQWPVTLRQLMAHVAGVRNDAGDEEDVFTRCEQTLDALDRFADAPLRFEPGTQYRYSSYGWILVTGAVEAAAEEPFFSFVQKQILQPLGMENTRLDSARDPTSVRAKSYHPKFGANTRYGPQPPDELDYSCFSGSSAFLSTPSDLVRLGLALQAGKLLQPATVQLLQTSQRLTSGQETGYGLGWDLESVTLAGGQRHLVLEDAVLRGGRVGTILADPERGLVVVVLTNISFADTTSVASSIAEAFAGEAGKPAGK